ncbi:MAG: amino acid permease [Acidobacteriia bacterium]|nr:amino acid permease [Terriglobia bacterium]
MRMNSPSSPGADSKEAKLSGQLTFFDLWCIGVAALVGAGIFVLTGVAAGRAGPALFVSFLIAGVVALLTALSFAELAGMFPDAGASYVYCREAFSTFSPRWGDFVSIVAGWTLMTQYVIVGSAVWLGFGLYARYLYAGFSATTWAALIGLLTTFLLYFGLKLSKHVINTLVLLKVLALVLFVVLGIHAAIRPSPPAQIPFMPFGWTGVVAAAALLAFGQTHIDAICMLAEEARNPRRDVPLATITSVLAVVLLYTLVGWTSVRIVDWRVLPNLDAPLATAIKTLLSTKSLFAHLAPAFIAVVGIAATATSGIGCLLGAPRVGLAMARHHKLPRFFATVHPRFQSPTVGTILLGLLGTGFALTGNLSVVASAGVFAALVVFVFVNISVLILRHKRPTLTRPFRIPLSIAGQPLPCILALLGVLGELYYLSWHAILIGLGWLASGLIVYFFYRDREASRV